MIETRPPAVVQAGIYTRLSKDPQGTKSNIAGQERRCREIVEQREWQVGEVYVDRDRTAAGRDPFRPAYIRMCEDLKAGRINAVVALDQDRLVREPYELELLLRLCEDTGVDHVVTSEGEITEEGVTMARFRASFAADEIRKMKVRHRRKKEDKAMVGAFSGGTRTFGYSSDHMTVIDDEAEMVRDAARRVIAGEAVEDLAREWNDRGVTTPRGKSWTGRSLRRLLRLESLIGLRVHHKGRDDEATFPAAWPPILDRAQWEAVGQVFASKPRPRIGRPPRVYLLTGFAVCGKCGSPMRGRPRRDKVRTYACIVGERPDGSRPCGGVRCKSEPLEELIFEKVLASLDEGALDRILSAGEDDDTAARRSDLLTQLTEAERKLRQAEERYLEGDVSRAAYVAVRDRHQATVDDVRRELVRLERVRLPDDTPRGADELRVWWPDAELEQKRQFLRLFLESIRIDPVGHGVRFSKDRIKIMWLI